MEKQTNYARSIFLLLLFVCIIVACVLLKVLSSVFIPITISCLLSFVFYPLLKTMNKKLHIPWVLGIIIILAIAFVAFFAVANLLISSTKTIISVYPKYESRFTSLYELFCNTFKIPFDKESSLFTNLWNSLNVRNAVQNFAISFSNYLLSFSKNLIMILLFIVFLLIEIKSMKQKVEIAFEGTFHGKLQNIFSNTINDVTRYISIKFIISLLTGIVVFLGCLALKLDFPIIWGFLSFILNFIPNFGSIISSVMTIVFAILQFYPSWWQVVATALLMLSSNMILGSFIEPRWEGTDLGLSPFIILVSLSLWGWMWGFLGMILAVPIMVIVKIICENISYLAPVAVLLGNGSKSSFRKEKDNETSDPANENKAEDDSVNK
ncbi:MAG: AI-2E family transporter [Treponema sp.]